MLQITMEGSKSLKRQLEAMTRAGQRSTVRRAARAGARAVGLEARRLAPRSRVPRHPKGHAFKMIRWKEVDSWPEKAEFAVGPSGWGWYLGLHETGTSRFPAQPFLRPAMDSQRQLAVNEMGVVFKDSILKAAQRAKGRR